MSTYTHNKVADNGDILADDCSCEIDDDHYEDGTLYGDDESLSVGDAADIWRSKGMDEDYMFGYTEEELRNA
jgi:hypothetical protein